jgi:hypothetical protein
MMTRFLASLTFAAVLAACSSSTASSPDPVESGSSADAPRDAASCVDLVASSADLACSSDDDCSPVVVGQVCPGFVPTVGDHLGTLCDNGAANSTGASRLAAELLAVPHGDDAGMDFCDAVQGKPRCISSQCVLCPASGAGPSDCREPVEAGASTSTTSMSSSASDDHDAGSCVDLVASSADLACESDGDCMPVIVGQVCPGFVPSVGGRLGTYCDNGAANATGASRLNAQLLAIPHGEDAGFDFCDAIPGTPRCLSKQCVMCPEDAAGGPPGCRDGG